MINVDKILGTAKEMDASDVHLICGLKPILRIVRDIKEIDEMDVLEQEDMYEIYDYFVRGNLDKDAVFKETRKLDASYEFEDIRLRVNISYADEVPTFTLRLIKKVLPKYEELGIPDIVKRAILQPQGLVLVTGKTNSRKNNNIKCIN